MIEHNFKDFTVSEWMKYIVSRKDVQVFQISVYRNDYRDSFFATATLRGQDNSYTCSADTPELALFSLNESLNSLTCPHCHQLLPEAK